MPILVALLLPFVFGYFWNKRQEQKWAKAALARDEKPMRYRDFPRV